MMMVMMMIKCFDNQCGYADVFTLLTVVVELDPKKV